MWISEPESPVFTLIVKVVSNPTVLGFLLKEITSNGPRLRDGVAYTPEVISSII